MVVYNIETGHWIVVNMSTLSLELVLAKYTVYYFFCSDVFILYIVYVMIIIIYLEVIRLEILVKVIKYLGFWPSVN